MDTSWIQYGTYEKECESLHECLLKDDVSEFEKWLAGCESWQWKKYYENYKQLTEDKKLHEYYSFVSMDRELPQEQRDRAIKEGLRR